MTDNKYDLDYLQPIEIAQGIHWVGYSDDNASLHCNPYLIVEDDEAVLIDGGSRDDFSTVMLKVLRVGVKPAQIKRLIYQHFDPDLCGNIPHLEAIINHDDLKIISHKENNTFINYYSTKSPKQCIEKLGFEYQFKTGRKLKFIRTPYAHAPGSFITLDCKTNTLFTSDIFGSYDSNWSLYQSLLKECSDCKPREICPINNQKCKIHGIMRFHQKSMNSARSLRYALEQIENVDAILIAPQHGSLIDSKVDLEIIIRNLKSMENVGFDYFLEENNICF